MIITATPMLKVEKLSPFNLLKKSLNNTDIKIIFICSLILILAVISYSKNLFQKNQKKLSQRECCKINNGQPLKNLQVPLKINHQNLIPSSRKEPLEKYDPPKLLKDKLAADKGNPEAQFKLALSYEKGIETTKDDQLAFAYYKKAADQGTAQAQFKVGKKYKKGLGILQDDLEAFKYYKLAADQGLAPAQYNVGVCYEKGTGITKDRTQAFTYYQNAANQGHVRALVNLGLCYELGRGTTKDFPQAFSCYKKAADKLRIKEMRKRNCT